MNQLSNKKSEKGSPEQPAKHEHSWTDGSGITLKERVFLKMDQFPNISIRELCRLLAIDYQYYKGTMASYRYEWRKHKSLMNRVHKAETHKARAWCFALKSFSRELALTVNWIQSKGKNAELNWKMNPSYGRIRWFQNGRIIIHVKKPQTMARVKRLLCLAFFDTGLIHDPKLLNPFLDKVRWLGASDVFKSGSEKRLPYMKIDKYKATHGIAIRLGDRSHPYDVEVDWVHPDWLEKLELMQEHNIKTIEEFTKFMKNLSQPKKPGKDKPFYVS